MHRESRKKMKKRQKFPPTDLVNYITAITVLQQCEASTLHRPYSVYRPLHGLLPLPHSFGFSTTKSFKRQTLARKHERDGMDPRRIKLHYTTHLWNLSSRRSSTSSSSTQNPNHPREPVYNWDRDRERRRRRRRRQQHRKTWSSRPETTTKN
jgi:hypothetical protein